MARGFRIFVLVLLVAFAGGCSTLCRVDLGRVLTSGRDGWQFPEQVVEALEIRPGDRVAEIGAGDGYWLAWLSRAVGSEGRVYAVEVEEEKVAALKRRVAEAGLENVVVIHGRYEDPQLPDGEVDLAMTVLTYHHIEDRPAYFQGLRKDLSPRGRVAHLDDRHDVGPPIRWIQAGHWSNPESIRDEMSQAGYERVASFDFLPVQSFQVFAPGPRAAAVLAPRSMGLR